MITGIVRGPRMSCAHASSDTVEATVRCLHLHIGTASSRSDARSVIPLPSIHGFDQNKKLLLSLSTKEIEFLKKHDVSEGPKMATREG
jgi:hypothetical protein